MDFEISTQWEGSSLKHAPVKLHLKKESEKYLCIEVDAPFFDDPKPSGEAGKPFPQLWDYEVVEAFFLGKDDKYLEVELCPHGQHLLLLLNGRRNMIKDELNIEYSSSIHTDTMRWTGKAKIPSAYFPAKVDRFNAYAIHGVNDNRVYEALYPAEGGKHVEPDFHRLEYFRAIDVSESLSDNECESDVWKEVLSK